MPIWVVGWFIPVAGVLILIHAISHTLDRVDLPEAGRVAPEPEQAVG